MRYFVLSFLVFLSLPASAEDRTCLILATAPTPTGMESWSQAGRQARHALLYVAGEYPSGVSFRNRIKDKELDKIKAKGRVIVLDSQYTRADLETAKQQCAGQR